VVRHAFKVLFSGVDTCIKTNSPLINDALMDVWPRFNLNLVFCF